MSLQLLIKVANIEIGRYSVQPTDQTFVIRYWYFYFGKNMGKKFSKNKIKNLSSEYSQKVLDHAKQSAVDALKTGSNTAIQKKP